MYTTQVECHDELGYPARHPLCTTLCHHTTINSARNCALSSLYEADCSPSDLDYLIEPEPVQWAKFADCEQSVGEFETQLVATLAVTDSEGYEFAMEIVEVHL